MHVSKTAVLSLLAFLTAVGLAPPAQADTTVQWSYAGVNYRGEGAAVNAMHAVSARNALLTKPAGETQMNAPGTASTQHKWVAPSPLIPTGQVVYWSGCPQLFTTEEAAAECAITRFYQNNVAACGSLSWQPAGAPVYYANLGSPSYGPGWTQIYNVTYWGAYTISPVTGCQQYTTTYDGVEHWTQYSCPQYYSLSNGACVDNDSDYVYSSPLYPPRCDANPPNKNSKFPLCGDPIDTALGDFWHSETDYSSPVLTLKRFYHSANLDTANGLGSGWTHQYAARLLKRSNGAIGGLLRPDGHEDVLVQMSSSNLYESTSGDGLHVTTTANGSNYIVYLPDGGSEIYDLSGTLIQLINAAGQTTTLNYTNGLLSSVAGPFGHTLQFSYNTDNSISQVTDPAGNSILYAYDSNNNLISVQYQDGQHRTYQYANPSFPNSLTSVTDENGVVLTSITYDSDGRATSSQNSGGADANTVAYGATSATITDSLGGTTVLSFAAPSGYPPVINSVTQNGSTRTYTIPLPATDAQQRPTQATDELGNVTTYTYDEAHVTAKTEAHGTAKARTTSYQYLSVGTALPTLITGPLGTTTYTYAGALIATKTLADPATGVSRKWSYTYDSAGRLITVDGPRTDVADVTTYTYFICATGVQCGQIQTVTDAAGHVTTFNSYNAHGQPLSITNPNGTVTTFAYDLRQRLISRQVGTEVTTFGYWPTGLLKIVTLPDGSSLQYTYDNAHRLIQVVDGGGNSIVYTLDSAGNRIAEKTYDPSGVLHHAHTRVFNQLNQLYQDINAANSPMVTTTYAYDAYGNQTSVSAPLTRTTGNTYDPLNRLSTVTDPANGVTTFTYDANDNLLSVTDPRSLMTSYGYNGLGDLLTQTSPDTGTTRNTYDSGGDLATSTDARGVVSTYTYDILNRITSVSYSLGGATDQILSFTYDTGTYGAGHLTAASDANHSLTWGYDALGRVSSQSQTVSSVTKSVGYSYTAGDLTTLTTPSGQTVTYGYNANHQITSVAVNGTTVLNGVTYEPLGPVNGWTWGNATTTTRSYSGDGVISQISSNGVKTYTYDNALRITGISDTSVGSSSWTYGYDALDRLTSGSNGTITRGWTYDANGNRLTETGSSPSTYTISPVSNQITGITGALARTYGYDAAGHTISYSSMSATYNNAGRLKTVSNGSATETLIYNALGQRIETSGGADGTVLYWYDEQGHLLGEYDGSGNLIQETVWLGDIPVATLRPNGSGVSIYYVHTDQLNTPRQVTRPSDSAQMWTWFSDPFGTDAANANPSGAGAFGYDLRLPGQTFDGQVGLHSNYFRDFDPATGRYVESDPIGLNGGSYSTYAYINGDPVNAIDPLGLAPPGRTAPFPGIPTIPTWPSSTQWSHDAALGLEDWLSRAGNAIYNMCRDAVDECYRRFDQEVVRCERWRGQGPVGDRDRWYRACKTRAADRRNLCRANKGPDPNEPPEWSDIDIPKDIPGRRR